jgi:hypothetical protein
MGETTSPLKRAGQVQAMATDDVALVQGIKAEDGDLSFEDDTNGVVTLTDIVNSAGPSPELLALIGHNANTGVLEGMALSVNGGDPTTVDIAAGNVAVIDAYTDTSTPAYTEVLFAGLTAVPLTTTGNTPATTYTLFALDVAGTVVQVAAESLLDADTRNLAFFAAAWHPDGDGGDVLAVSPFGNTAQASSSDINDFRRIFKTLRASGLQVQPNGPNKSLNRTSGVTNSAGAGGFDNATKRQTPSNKAHPTVILGQIYRGYRAASGALITDGPSTVWEPGVWDDGSGTLQAFPSANSWGIARAYLGPASTLVMGVPQKTYRTYQDAVNDLEHSIIEAGDLAAWLPTTWCVFLKTATDFSDPAQARFFEIPPLYRLGGGGVSGTSSAQIVTRYATTVATEVHAIRNPAAPTIYLPHAGNAQKISALFPRDTDPGGGDFSFEFLIGGLTGGTVSFGTVTVLAGERYGEFVNVQPADFPAGVEFRVNQTSVGAFDPSATDVERDCTLTVEFIET